MNEIKKLEMLKLIYQLSPPLFYKEVEEDIRSKIEIYDIVVSDIEQLREEKLIKKHISFPIIDTEDVFSNILFSEIEPLGLEVIKSKFLITRSLPPSRAKFVSVDTIEILCPFCSIKLFIKFNKIPLGGDITKFQCNCGQNLELIWPV